MYQVTLAIIKPDAVRLNVVGEILAFIGRPKRARRGRSRHHHLNLLTKLDSAAREGRLQPIAIQMATGGFDFWATFYEEHAGKPFFDELCTFMASGPSVFVVLEGDDAISEWRELMGATNPAEAAEGTLRRLYGTRGPANAVHGSASQADAERELNLVERLLSYGSLRDQHEALGRELDQLRTNVGSTVERMVVICERWETDSRYALWEAARHLQRLLDAGSERAPRALAHPTTQELLRTVLEWSENDNPAAPEIIEALGPWVEAGCPGLER